MIRTLSSIALAGALSLVLTACGDSSPGPIAGTWQGGGALPLKIQFRDGETEAMGMIEKVGYKVDGQSVLVTYKNGLMQGTSVRFVVVNPTTVQSDGTMYRKVGS